MSRFLSFRFKSKEDKKVLEIVSSSAKLSIASAPTSAPTSAPAVSKKQLSEEGEIPEELAQFIGKEESSRQKSKSEMKKASSKTSSKTSRKGKEKSTNKSASLSTNQILEKEEQEVMNLVETFCISKSLAWEICDRFNWKMERVNEYLLERAAELDEKEMSTSSTSTSILQEIDCLICGDSVNFDDSYRLSLCPDDHRFCQNCWGSHAKVQISEGTLPISCMSPKCLNHLVDIDFVSEIVDSKTFELFKYKTATHFMTKTKRMRWCPSGTCSKAVEFSDSQINCDVRCECGTPFCFTCGNECHSPIDCATYRRWCDKCFSEGESARWIQIFTRPCPNPQCMKPIEKNGGCPHMNCKACNVHFCWTCMELYVNGSHTCKRINQPISQSEDEKTKSYGRYKNAFLGFDSCIAKEKAFKSLVELAKTKTIQYRDLYSEHWNKATPFEDAVQIYGEVLRTLRFAFVFVYFVEESNSKDASFFIFLEEEFLRTVEQLERLVSSTDYTAEVKDEVKRVANSAKLKAQSFLSSAKENTLEYSDFYLFK